MVITGKIRKNSLSSRFAWTILNNWESLDKKISAHKEKLDEVQKKYVVYRDILETFFEVSKDDYLTKLEEEERQRKEELQKKKKKLKR